MGIPWDGTDKYVPWTTLVITFLTEKYKTYAYFVGTARKKQLLKEPG